MHISLYIKNLYNLIFKKSMIPNFYNKNHFHIIIPILL